jgi:hypothetical protein
MINAGLKAHSKSVKDFNLDVMYSIESKDQGDTKPLLAISASYDSFGAAPTLSSGFESSLSPILGVLHMSRVFKREFQHIPQRFDLMFILTPSGSLNYQATEKYLDYLQGNIKSKIQLVVCLDQLIDSSK